MRISALPARLEPPQALSPTTPPPGEATFQSVAAPASRSGGSKADIGRTGDASSVRAAAAAAAAGGGPAGALLSPSALMLSPGTDFNRGSAFSAADMEELVGVDGGNGIDVQFGGLGEKDDGDRGDALSPWITTREGAIL